MTDRSDRATSAVDKSVLRVAYTAVFTGLLATLDSTIVVVSLDDISRDLHSSLSAAQWVVTGYLLTLALSLPISGWLVDRVGVRRSFLVAVSAFAVASAACALAPSLTVLIALRVVQGLVGGLLVPMGQVIVTQVTPDDQLGRVMSLVGAPAALGPVLGPVAGGLVTTFGSWRWVFLINIPIAAVAFIQGARRLPHASQGEAPHDTQVNRDAQVNRLDVVGLLLLGPGLALLVYAMTTLGGSPGGDAGSSRPALGVNLGWGCAAAGLVLLGLFAWWARRRPPNGPRAALVGGVKSSV